jgi:signal transduction histidine kinase/ActR/RegA family two-component response regulator
VILGAVLPGALLTGVMVRRTLADSRSAMEHRLVDAARVNADALDREFNGTIRVLEMLAQSGQLQRGDLAAFWPEAVRAARAQDGWFAVVVLSPDGMQLMHTDVPYGEPLRRATEPLSLAQVVATRRPAVGALTPGQRDGRLRYPVRVPVERDGKLISILTALMEPASLRDVVRSQLPETEEWTRAIVDPAFRIAVRSRGGDRYVGRPVSGEAIDRLKDPPSRPFEGTSLEGDRVYSAVVRGAYGWTTSVTVPAAVLDGPGRASVVAIVSGGAVLILGGLLGVLLVSRRLSREFMAARDAAAALAEGRTPEPIAARVAEAQQVHESLHRATLLLRERERERDEQLKRAVAAQALAEDANRTKDSFLAVLGHELRNPLAPALTALELMRLRGGTALQRERQVLERQILHMTRLVDDLLDISRLTRGKVELVRRRFELSVAVDRAIDMARPLAERSEHALRVDVPQSGLPLDADEDRIVQILVNLLTNAAKYTPAGGRLTLTARAGGNVVEIACEDNGPGVEPELVPTMFEPFAQGPRSLARQQGGLGLGLALARSLTEMHGGTLRYQPVAPHGSRFVVRLPMASGSAAGEPARVPAVSRRIEPRRVLLVDDNEDGRDMMHLALKSAGHVVESAADGEAALAAAATLEPNVAILDIGLPGIDGYELARMLRRQHPHLRLIAVTGLGQESDADAARAAGFDAHCAKPITVSALLDQIASLEEDRVRYSFDTQP